MSELATWLERLGLSKYVATFIENEVEFSDLTDLTESDLRELGLPVGPRRRLLKAAERLSAAPASREDRQQAATSIREASNGQQSTGVERRQLTVLFVDLVGSTTLARRLDPEDLRTLMGRYQTAVAEAIGETGGYLANWLGDGAIAYFGWPTAREDQSIEAIRAGLAAIVAVGEIPVIGTSEERLAARVGIATGQVVVGDLKQGVISEQGKVTGETPNLAARLESIAPAGGVVVCPTTQALARAIFDLEFLGPQELKGFGVPVAAWLVRAERQSESRFEAPGTRLTTFTGRTHEVGLLLDRWRQIQEGEGQVVLISGEPGIGKSRIVQTFRDRIEGDRHHQILYQCSPHHDNSVLYPAIRQFEYALGFATGESVETKLDKLEDILRKATPDISKVAPLVASLLSIPFTNRYDVLDQTPQQQRSETLRALRNQLLGLATEQPVLFVLEDAHWIDPTTQELIVTTVPRLTDQRVLMLITHRPEWRLPFQGPGHVTALNMTRLSRSQIGEIVRDVAKGVVPEEVIARIVDRTDGVPLFVEELTRAMAETNFAFGDEDVPVTLQASLMARLDRLGLAKETAQIGSVVGREFGRSLLMRLVDNREALDANLDRLVASQLIFRTRLDQGEIYTFKHALIQDIAYESLLRQRRQELHLAIAEALAVDETQDTALEVLALHFELGGDPNRATQFWERAGDAAAARFAQPEAVAHYERALKMKGTTTSRTKDDRATLSLLFRLAQAQFGAFGGAAPPTLSTFLRARTLAKELDAETDACIALYGAWVGLIIAARMKETATVADELVDLAARTGSIWMQITGYRALGSTQFLLGQLGQAEETFSRCLSLVKAGDAAFPAAFAHDPALTAPVVMANVEWARGKCDVALDRSEACVARAIRRTTDPNTMTFILVWHLLLCLMARNSERMKPVLEKLSDHTNRTGGAFPKLGLLMALGGYEVLEGKIDAAVENLRTGLDGWLGSGQLQCAPMYQLFLAEAHWKKGDPAAALDVLEEARQLVERTEQRIYEPEVHRFRGVFLESIDRIEDAEAAFRKAVSLASKQGNISWRDRAAANITAAQHRN
ncbi:MAG: AAA family ATPase [Arenibacterium sp.]